MIPHLFKILWNSRKSNILTLIEITFAFMILTALFILLIFGLEKFNEPMGFNYKNVWMIEALPKNYYLLNTEEDWRQENIRMAKKNEKLREISKDLKASYPRIENIEPSHFSTFAYFTRTGEANVIEYNGKRIRYQFCFANESLPQILGIKITEGQWFTANDFNGKSQNVILSRKIAQVLFPNENVVGKVFGEPKKKVIGIVDYFRFNGEFSDALNLIFFPGTKYEATDGLILKTKGIVPPSFQRNIIDRLKMLSPDLNFKIHSMEALRTTYLRKFEVPVAILSVLIGFLIVNIMLGLFGNLWQKISNRKSEIGLRLAVGSTTSLILYQIIGETYILVICGVAIGFLFTSQFFIYNVFDVPISILIQGNIISFILLLVFCTLSVLAPAKFAAKLKPASSLREE